MLKELLKNKKFNEIIDFALNKGTLLDIILFGSSVKGKDEPEDIDLILVYAFKEDKDHNYEIKKRFENSRFKAHIVSISYSDIWKPSFLARESIILEGYSFRNKQFLFSSIGLSSFVLFRYKLGKMNNSERMRFYYSLYGRGKTSGVLKAFESYKFSDNIIACPIGQSENIKEFFEKKGIKCDIINILLPSRLSSRKFMELQ